ncbi:hypothetical protein Pcac1_g2251 [Phytophthora cactorum]|uniref:Uncharacterized protein n=1 Tax=Phytophthora cactorum TaxID=29920 RepID=A0A8T0YIN7_9STRA|nr:hypothetical protein Pcac1_g2251 [Phytophthora cactorum]KAG2819491.1 hypothetical protein PC111_g11871 [Phytophthora cactorum]KAG2822917.1 hypothetical protein PC112_g10732 [Phytophthora cactorum]KAG2848415.1 hypothetical protein PC113_g17583 [Phytophthora cactorum]KAG2886753.1 hypothetical protein PC114_g19108 [Phytophthora cactorum]
MITTREVDPCESKMLLAKVQIVPCIPDTSDYDSSEMDEENRKELVRRGAVGRRCAIVALPADILAAIAEVSELKCSCVRHVLKPEDHRLYIRALLQYLSPPKTIQLQANFQQN